MPEKHPGKKFRSEEIPKIKDAVVALISDAKVKTLTQAAEMLVVSPVTLHRWYKTDLDWKAEVDCAQQVIADQIEIDIDRSKNVIGQIFRLKKLRPEYRDDHRISNINKEFQELLGELRKLGKIGTKITIEGQVKELEPPPKPILPEMLFDRGEVNLHAPTQLQMELLDE